MDISFTHSIWTVVVLIIFVGISLWAFSGKNKDDFEKAGQIPFDDDDELVRSQKNSTENNHG